MIYLDFVANPEKLGLVHWMALDGNYASGKFIVPVTELYVMMDLAYGIVTTRETMFDDTAVIIDGKPTRTYTSADLSAWAKEFEPDLYDGANKIMSPNSESWNFNDKWFKSIDDNPNRLVHLFGSREKYDEAKKMYAYAIQGYLESMNQGKSYYLNSHQETRSIVQKLITAQVSADTLFKGIKERFPSFNELKPKITQVYTGGWSIQLEGEETTVEGLLRKLDELTD